MFFKIQGIFFLIIMYHGKQYNAYMVRKYNE